MTALGVAAGARADTVEFTSGQRIDGVVRELDGASVVVEIEGQIVRFERQRVRAIYLTGSPRAHPVPPPAGPPPPPPGPASQPGGKLTLEVDFPHAWYLQVLWNKISERWESRALPGPQPTVLFEIQRDGRVDRSTVKVARSSGNAHYDDLAVRSITEAQPFPALPEHFNGSSLRIHIQFDYRRRG